MKPGLPLVLLLTFASLTAFPQKEQADTVIIPGHGPLARRADLIAWRGTIATAVERVSALKEAGRTLDQAKAAKPLAGMSNNPNGFIGEDAFVESIWGSLEAHGA